MAMHTQSPGRRFDGEALDLSGRFSAAPTPVVLTELPDGSEEPDGHDRLDDVTALLLTSLWPLGGDDEDALVRPEAEALARRFGRVIVVPAADRGQCAELPAGVQVSRCLAVSPLLRKRWRRWLLWLGNPFRLGSTYWAAAKSVDIELRRMLKRHGLDGTNCVAEAIGFGVGATGLMLSALRTDIRYMVRVMEQDLLVRCAPRLRGRTIAVSDGVRPTSSSGVDALVARYPDLRHKIARSLPGVDVRRLPVARRHDAGSGAVTLLSVGTVDRKARVRLCLECALALAQARPDLSVKWVHVGNGPEMEQLRRDCAGPPANLTIELRGSMPHTDLLQLYAAEPVDFFLHFDTGKELPISLLEAMGCGIIVVATDTGDITEAVDSETGVPVPEDFSPDEFPWSVIPYIDGDARARAMRDAAMAKVRRLFEAAALRDEFSGDLAALL